MYILSQINEFSDFFSNKKSNILTIHLCKNKENDYVFIPMYFMKQLNKYNSEIVDFKKEKLPI